MARTLRNKGFQNIMVLRGGFEDWAEQGLATISKPSV